MSDDKKYAGKLTVPGYPVALHLDDGRLRDFFASSNEDPHQLILEAMKGYQKGDCINAAVDPIYVKNHAISFHKEMAEKAEDPEMRRTHARVLKLLENYFRNTSSP